MVCERIKCSLLLRIICNGVLVEGMACPVDWICLMKYHEKRQRLLRLLQGS